MGAVEGGGGPPTIGPPPIGGCGGPPALIATASIAGFFDSCEID